MSRVGQHMVVLFSQLLSPALLGMPSDQHHASAGLPCCLNGRVHDRMGKVLAGMRGPEADHNLAVGEVNDVLMLRKVEMPPSVWPPMFLRRR